MSKVSIKGVLIGSVVDITAFSVFFILVGIVILIHDGRSAHGTFHRRPTLTAILVISGLVFSVLGGYLAARVARHDEILNGGFSSFLCVLVSLLQIITGRSTFVATFLTLIAVPVCGALGGYLRLRQRQAETPPV